jgi:flagellar assembly factor FliW
MLATGHQEIQSNLAFSAGIGTMGELMKHSATETVIADTAPPANLEVIETRFGTIEADRNNAIHFEHGLLGVPNSKRFVLVDFPSQKLAQFRLLQSLDDKNLSFITLPLEVENAIIERADIEKACGDIGISPDNLAILLIVSVHRTPTDLNITVNARAPLVIDVGSRHAIQYVFQHSRYKVQQPLQGDAA